MTSTREDEKQIAMARLGGGPVVEWEKRAGKLWDLLDEIDTFAEMYNAGSYDAFRKGVASIAEKRHKILESDGYQLYVPGTMPVSVPKGFSSMEPGTLADVFAKARETDG